jgi:hypothetical protein
MPPWTACGTCSAGPSGTLTPPVFAGPTPTARSEDGTTVEHTFVSGKDDDYDGGEYWTATTRDGTK